jgi:hypothetical protein
MSLSPCLRRRLHRCDLLAASTVGTSQVRFEFSNARNQELVGGCKKQDNIGTCGSQHGRDRGFHEDKEAPGFCHAPNDIHMEVTREGAHSS